jgi:hypothetical protein
MSGTDSDSDDEAVAASRHDVRQGDGPPMPMEEDDDDDDDDAVQPPQPPEVVNLESDGDDSVPPGDSDGTVESSESEEEEDDGTVESSKSEEDDDDDDDDDDDADGDDDAENGVVNGGPGIDVRVNGGAVDPGVPFTANRALFHVCGKRVRLLEETNRIIKGTEWLRVAGDDDDDESMNRMFSHVKQSIALGKASPDSGIGKQIVDGKIGPEAISVWKFDPASVHPYHPPSYALSILMVGDGESDPVKRYYDSRHVRFLSDNVAVFLRENEGFVAKLGALINKADAKSPGYLRMRMLLQRAKKGVGWELAGRFFLKNHVCAQFSIETAHTFVPTSAYVRMAEAMAAASSAAASSAAASSAAAASSSPPLVLTAASDGHIVPLGEKPHPIPTPQACVAAGTISHPDVARVFKEWNSQILKDGTTAFFRNTSDVGFWALLLKFVPVDVLPLKPYNKVVSQFFALLTTIVSFAGQPATRSIVNTLLANHLDVLPHIVTRSLNFGGTTRTHLREECDETGYELAGNELVYDKMARGGLVPCVAALMFGAEIMCDGNPSRFSEQAKNALFVDRVAMLSGEDLSALVCWLQALYGPSMTLQDCEKRRYGVVALKAIHLMLRDDVVMRHPGFPQKLVHAGVIPPLHAAMVHLCHRDVVESDGPEGSVRAMVHPARWNWWVPEVLGSILSQCSPGEAHTEAADKIAEAVNHEKSLFDVTLGFLEKAKTPMARGATMHLLVTLTKPVFARPAVGGNPRRVTNSALYHLFVKELATPASHVWSWREFEFQTRTKLLHNLISFNHSPDDPPSERVPTKEDMELVVTSGVFHAMVRDTIQMSQSVLKQGGVPSGRFYASLEDVIQSFDLIALSNHDLMGYRCNYLLHSGLLPVFFQLEDQLPAQHVTREHDELRSVFKVFHDMLQTHGEAEVWGNKKREHMLAPVNAKRAEIEAEDHRLAAVRKEAGAREVLEERPNFHLCPICREIMIDPVVAADGNTFERVEIETWLRKARPIRSPLTNIELESTVLYPNQSVKQAIQEWLKETHERAMAEAEEKAKRPAKRARK